MRRRTESRVGASRRRRSRALWRCGLKSSRVAGRGRLASAAWRLASAVLCVCGARRAMWCVRGVLRMAVCRALCGVVGTRDVSECDWRRSAACEAWRAKCCVRSVLCRVRCGRRASWRRVHSPAAPRRVGAFVVLRAVCCVRSVLCRVRCGRRASWKRVRGGGGLKGPLRHGAPAHCGCACVWVVSGWRLRCRVRGVGRKVCVREVLRTVRCGRRASWKQVRGGGGLWSSLRRGLRGVPGVCVCSRDEQTARNVSVR